MSQARGTTILELIVAMGIIITGLLTLLGLIVRSINLGTLTKNEFIATALSQEGIEAVRAIRDSNGLEIQSGKRDFEDWDYNLYECVTPEDETCSVGYYDYTGVPEVSYDYTDPVTAIATVWVMNFDSNTQEEAPVYQYKDGTSTPGLFIQWGAGQTGDMDTTMFSRLVTLEPICDNAGVPTVLRDMPGVSLGSDGLSDAPACPTQKIGIHIVSNVSWIEQGKTENVTLSHDIYDWR